MSLGILYAPWRDAYVNTMVCGKSQTCDASQCIFCVQFAEQNDERYFIIRRFAHTIVMLNLYPYNAGHLLLLPLTHSAQLIQLDCDTQKELMWLIAISTEIVQQVLGAQGVNIGINIGKSAGAGIPSHLHTHILPRWIGDTNFLPTLAHTKQISTDLQAIYAQLKPAFDAL